MDRFGLNSKKDELFESIQSKNNNIREYFLTELQHQSVSTQINRLIAIKRLFKITGKNDGRKIIKEDILNLLECDWYNSLKSSSKKISLHNIRMYLRFCFSDEEEETELIKMLKKKVNKLVVKQRQLNKEDLISREHLNLILKNVNTKLQALIMILFEGGLRKGELLNIRLKDIGFEGVKAKINIKVTKVRNGSPKAKIISLYEAIPYLKRWIDKNDFKPDDYIFPYKNLSSLNATLNYTNERMKKLYPDKWNHKKIYPHLARHSRITELYSSGQFSGDLMGKFASWEPGSHMSKVYSHLIDSDVENKLDEIRGLSKEDKSKTIQPIICPICSNINNPENVFCWKCNNILDETKSKEIGINLIKKNDEVYKLMENQERIIKLLINLYFKNITKELYPEIELSKEAETELMNQIVREYNDIIK